MSHIGFTLSAAALFAALGGPALAKTEKDFLAGAIKGDSSEIVLGQLALSKSNNPGVKAFAQTLVDDHTKAKAQASTVAEEMNLVPPSAVMPEAEQELKMLEKLDGGAFDKEFVRYMVNDHEKDVTNLRKESQSGSGPAQNLASETLPTLEKHLQMAKALETGK